MIRWVIYGLVAIACAATVTLAWEHFVIAPAEARGAARQAAKDAPVIADLTTKLAKATSDNATLAKERDEWKARFKQAQDDGANAAKQVAADKADAAKKTASRVAFLIDEVARLAALAGAPPQPTESKSCAAIDSLLDGYAARRLRDN